MLTIQKKVKKIIDEELIRANIHVDFEMQNIHMSPYSKSLIEYTSDVSLSEAIINHHFPRITEEIEVAHFTKFDKFKCIIGSEELRLFPILKHKDEKEFLSFYETHGLSAFLDYEDGEPYGYKLMRELYYTSFTRIDNVNENYMWNAFAGSGTGVKIIFKISVKHKRADLRPVLYHSESKNPSTLIKTMSDRILDECGKHFIIRGISRIGAFFLPLGYSLEDEEETRLLIRSSDTAKKLIVQGKEYPYLPLKIGKEKNEFCNIEISGIYPGKNCNKQLFKDTLSNSSFNGFI